MNVLNRIGMELRDLMFGARQLPRRLLGRLRRLAGRSNVTVVGGAAAPALLEILGDRDTWNASWETLEEFAASSESSALFWSRVAAFESSLVPPGHLFEFEGYCAVCHRDTIFYGDFLYSDGRLPNWRERLTCRYCKLANRARAMLDILETELAIPESANVYVTEQSSPFFRALARRYTNIVGSEYLPGQMPPGRLNFWRIRNEDLTRLTFRSESRDLICTADVLEHVPEFRAAIAECFRCLKPGGHFLISVPFMLHSAETTVRARVRPNGAIEHLVEPEYHGDPLDERGLLCFYHFGWDLLDELRSAGFCDARVRVYWSFKRAYLGGPQIAITARRPLQTQDREGPTKAFQPLDKKVDNR